MKRVILTILMCCAASWAYATSQIPEVLIYEDIANDMYSTPLESYFSANNPKPKLFYEHASSTACRRAYVGTWRIQEDELYLVGLRKGYPSTDPIPLEKITPKWSSPVKATWFTGTIRIGLGKVLMGSPGLSEKRETDIFFEIEAGKVLSVRQVNHTNKKEDTDSKKDLSVTIAKIIFEIESIKPGMTRADLLKIFTEDGGFCAPNCRKYVYRGCPYIKVTVEFKTVENAGNKILGNSGDIITKISQPFLEFPILD
jgi:hypothetical protein